MSVLVASPGTATSLNHGLKVTAWMAQETSARLTAAGHAVVTVGGPNAVRATLADAVVAVSCVIIAAHGDDWAVYDAQGQPLLDATNVHMLAEKSCHAVACLTGVELAGLAVAAGARCYVGYEATLNVEWDPYSLPPGGAARIAALVTETSLHLAEGDLDEDSLRKAADSPAQALFAWLDDHIEQLPVLETMALLSLGEQLGGKFCVRTRADTADQD